MQEIGIFKYPFLLVAILFFLRSPQMDGLPSGEWHDDQGNLYLFRTLERQYGQDRMEIRKSSDLFGQITFMGTGDRASGAFYLLGTSSPTPGQLQFLTNYSLSIRVGLELPLYLFQTPKPSSPGSGSPSDSIVFSDLAERSEYLLYLLTHVQENRTPEALFWIRKNSFRLLDLLVTDFRDIHDLDFLNEIDGILNSCPDFISFRVFRARQLPDPHTTEERRFLAMRGVFNIFRAVFLLTQNRSPHQGQTEFDSLTLLIAKFEDHIRDGKVTTEFIATSLLPRLMKSATTHLERVRKGSSKNFKTLFKSYFHRHVRGYLPGIGKLDL